MKKQIEIKIKVVVDINDEDFTQSEIDEGFEVLKYDLTEELEHFFPFDQGIYHAEQKGIKII